MGGAARNLEPRKIWENGSQEGGREERRERERGRKVEGVAIYPDFPLDSTVFFSGKHLIPFLVLWMKNFRNFVLLIIVFSFLTMNKFT